MSLLEAARWAKVIVITISQVTGIEMTDAILETHTVSLFALVTADPALLSTGPDEGNAPRRDFYFALSLLLNVSLPFQRRATCPRLSPGLSLALLRRGSLLETSPVAL